MGKVVVALIAAIFAGALAVSTTADARMGGGGFRGGGGFHGGMIGGGFRGGGFRGAMIGGGFRGAAFRSGFVGSRGAAFRRGFVGPRGFAFRHGFAPRFNRFAFARFHRFHHRRFVFAPFVAGVGFYGSSCWTWQPTPWGWQRVWICDDDYGYY